MRSEPMDLLLGQVVKEFLHGLDSILTDSVKTPELDAFFYEFDAITYSESSGSYTQYPFW